MKNFELKIYQLIERKTDIKDFEQWVYAEKGLEDRLSSEDYLELISLDYRSPATLYEAEKILKRYIDHGKYYEWRLRRVLQKIIERPRDVHIYIEQCYDMYCDGYNFLDNLGLGYGLAIAVPPNDYTADSWDKLQPNEQKIIIGSFYPEVSREAKKVLHWIDAKKIILTGYAGSHQGILYQDNRTPEEKEPKAYKVAKLANKY